MRSSSVVTAARRSPTRPTHQDNDLPNRLRHRLYVRTGAKIKPRLGVIYRLSESSFNMGGRDKCKVKY